MVKHIICAFEIAKFYLSGKIFIFIGIFELFADELYCTLQNI